MFFWERSAKQQTHLNSLPPTAASVLTRFQGVWTSAHMLNFNEAPPTFDVFQPEMDK